VPVSAHSEGVSLAAAPESDARSRSRRSWRPKQRFTCGSLFCRRQAIHEMRVAPLLHRAAIRKREVKSGIARNLRDSRREITNRTQFYSLRAKGMGTPLVEGLTGYLRRLAAVHGVTVADLICHNHFDGLFRHPGDHRMRRRLFLASGYLLDGPGDQTDEWILALESATGQWGLSNLTLSPFAGISSFSWLRRRRAWCPHCLSVQAHNSPDELYEPLVWSIRLVSVCPVDLTPLVQMCRNCHA